VHQKFVDLANEFQDDIDPSIRLQRLRRYVNKRRQEDNLINKIIKKFNLSPEHPAIIAFGAANFSNLKGTKPSPGAARMMSWFQRRPDIFTVVPVDEYHTSQVCNGCQSHALKQFAKRTSRNPKTIAKQLKNNGEVTKSLS
jgi:hypothetical protein